MRDTRFDTKTFARWMGTFIGFPLAGLAARAVAGNIDDLRSATIGGLAAGAVLGAVQSVGMRRDRRRPEAWIAATAIGFAAGLAIGASAVNYDTDAASLAVMGALTGLGVGIAQALVLVGSRTQQVVWATATPALWALGWFITSQVIVDADRQHANFGASGALIATALSGLVLAISSRPTLASSSIAAFDRTAVS
jgi:hypothetical protein